MDARFPIGELQFPEHVTFDHIQQWLDEIGNYSNRLRETVDELDPSQRRQLDSKTTCASYSRFTVEYVSTFKTRINR